MRSTAIVLIALTVMFLCMLPILGVNYFVWLDSLRETFACASFSLAETLGASGMTLNGTVITLSNGEKVNIAHSCIDFTTTALVAVAATLVITLVLALKGYAPTKLGILIMLILTFIVGTAVNIVRMGVTLYLANCYYASLVQSAGWQTFHDSVAFFIYTLYIAFCAFLAYAFAKP